jgi:hypothetical protein
MEQTQALTQPERKIVEKPVHVEATSAEMQALREKVKRMERIFGTEWLERVR